MTDAARTISWREVVITAFVIFLVAASGSVAAFALWVRELSTPQVVLLGSGNRLSLLVIDGPARLLLATGDGPVDFENALTSARPIFARRVDVLLIAGSGSTLLVPLAARGDSHIRSATALAPLPRSVEADAIGAIPSFASPQRIRLGPSVTVTVETALPFGADAEEDFPAWRATIEHGQTRVVVLSDGPAASLFPPPSAPSVLVISGADPAAAWDLAPAVAFVANSEMIGGPELRDAFSASRRRPEWGYRVFPGEALRIRFVPGGIELPSEPAQNLAGTPAGVGIIPRAEAAPRVIPRDEGPSRLVAAHYATTRFLAAARSDTDGSLRSNRTEPGRRIKRRGPPSRARTRP